MEGGEGGMEGVREGVRWGDVCVRLPLARPVGRLTDTTTLPPQRLPPLALHSHPLSGAVTAGLSSLPSWARVWVWVWAPERRHLAKCFEIV